MVWKSDGSSERDGFVICAPSLLPSPSPPPPSPTPPPPLPSPPPPSTPSPPPSPPPPSPSPPPPSPSPPPPTSPPPTPPPVTSGTCPDVQSSTASDSYNSWCHLSSSLFAIPGSHIAISMKWKDQGWGNQKGRVGLFTVLADGVAVYTTPIAPHSLTAFSDTIQLPAGMKDLEFKYKVGSGGGHSITIRDFAWSWKPPLTSTWTKHQNLYCHSYA